MKWRGRVVDAVRLVAFVIVPQQIGRPRRHERNNGFVLLVVVAPGVVSMALGRGLHGSHGGDLAWCDA